MNIYDDKTKGIIESNGSLILPAFEDCSEAIFKASYVVVSDIQCSGKITALFNLTVLGDVEAAELDVKGRFICTGKCVINGALVVQNDIWVEDIRADTIESHDRIIAQEIDADTVQADGDIIVGKILAIAKLAQSRKNILCGETAYGAGKVAANTVITGEPLDLDEGEDTVVAPYLYKPKIATGTFSTQACNTIDNPDYFSTGDWSGYLDYLIENTAFETDKQKFEVWKEILTKVDGLIRNGIIDCRDLTLLIWTVGIACSDYFSEWSQVKALLTAIDNHFAALAQTDKSSIACSVESYGELLQALDILNRYGDSMDRLVYGISFEMLMSYFGLKSKFVTERLNEKGWKDHG